MKRRKILFVLKKRIPWAKRIEKNFRLLQRNISLKTYRLEELHTFRNRLRKLKEKEFFLLQPRVISKNKFKIKLKYKKTVCQRKLKCIFWERESDILILNF